MTKFYEILKALKPIEFKRLGKFLMSPYYNESRRMVAVYNFLQNESPGFDTERVTKEKVFNYVYSGKKYNELNARKLISNFTKLLEEFLAMEEYRSDRTYLDKEILISSRKRSLSKTFKGNLKNLIKHQKDCINRDENFYLTQVGIEEEIYSFYADIFIYKLEQFQKISDNVDLYFILKKLEVFYNMVITKLIYPDRANFKMEFFDGILSYIKENLTIISEQHPNIYVYYFFLMTLLNPDDEHYFYNLKDYMFKNIQKITKWELRKVFVVLYNYGLKKIKNGVSRYNSEVYDIIKKADELLIEPTSMSNFDIYFLYVVSLGLQHKEPKWVEYYIHKYKNYIPAEFRKTIFKISLASLSFHNRNYKQALKLLLNLNYANPYYYVYAKSTEIKIYYETDEIEGVFSLIDSMKHFIKGKKIIKEQDKVGYRKFLNYCLKLVKIKENERGGLSILKKKLENEDIVAHKDWLAQKAEELEDKPDRFLKPVRFKI